MELNEKELKSIQGGLLKIALSKALIGFGIGFTLLVGLINGYQNPLPCNNK